MNYRHDDTECFCRYCANNSLDTENIDMCNYCYDDNNLLYYCYICNNYYNHLDICKICPKYLDAKKIIQKFLTHRTSKSLGA